MKKWIIVALALVILGLMLGVGAASLMKFDFRSMNTARYRTETYPVKESFRSISVEANTEDVRFLPAEDGKARVVCVEEEDAAHSVEVVNGTLTVKSVRKTHFSFGMDLSPEQSSITVHLPEKTYEALQVSTDTGDVELPADFSFVHISLQSDTGDVICLASVKNELHILTQTGDISLESVSADSLELETDTGSMQVSSVRCSGDVSFSTDTGKMSLRDLSCRSLTSRSDTGDLLLERVVAEDSFSVTSNTGDVEFRDSDAASITVTTDTGDVTGTLLTDKVFQVKTDTGSVHVPDSVSGGSCRITTDTGDIRIRVA